MAHHNPLGQKIQYPKEYSPEVLFPIARQDNRSHIGITNSLPFTGVDIWNIYELSWLNPKGKPEIGIAELIVPCESTHIFESKSLKLYLNSFNNHTFQSVEDFKKILIKDLSTICESPISVNIYTPDEFSKLHLDEFEGINLDQQDIEINDYNLNPDHLKTLNEDVEESVYSNLYRSNCEVTSQPDWGSLLIQYSGKKIEHAGLLRYIISFRNHCEFNEPCVERIFTDIQKYCQPKKLMVYMRTTRRGGIDINPLRTNFDVTAKNMRLVRQ